MGDPSPQDNVTEELCKFIVETTYEQLDAPLIDKLKDLLTDSIGIAAGAATNSESTEPFLQAISSLSGHNHHHHNQQQQQQPGTSTVFTKGRFFSPQHAGFLNAAFAHTFDYDDTHASSILHPGATAIPAALAQAEALAPQTSNDDGGGGKDLLLALALADEVTCRVGRAFNYGGYARGFHNTSTAGVFGAVAAVARLRGLSLARVRDAFGLAGSRAAGSMQFLDNGAWNKRLHPGFAVHDAFVVVALAEAGVVGASRPLEGRYGALWSFSASATTEGLVRGLGREWIFRETAVKPFPACRMTHSAIEVVGGVAKEVEVEGTGKVVEKIVVALSPGCFPIVGPAEANKIHPKTVVDAQFSMFYQVAISWLYGMDIGWDMYDKSKMESAEVAALCEKVKVVIDNDVVDLAARVTFTWTDGTTTEVRQDIPLGEEAHPFGRERIQNKFRRMVASTYDEDKVETILRAIQSIEEWNVKEFMELL